MGYTFAVVTLLVTALTVPEVAATVGPSLGNTVPVLTFRIPKFPPGHNCTTSGECVEHAVCNVTEDSKGQTICVCDDSHYSDYRTCLPRLIPGEKCSWVYEDMCVLGAVCHCDRNSHCQCDCAGQLVNDFYNSGTKTCQIRSRSGQGCDDQHPCVDNAVCTNQECQCHAEFYFDDEQFCRARIFANHVCNETKQCVEHAECRNNTNNNNNNNNNNTINKCTCQRDFYVNDTHHCAPRLPFNGTCNETKQCLVNGECAHNFCRCDNGSYNNRNQCHKTLDFNDYCDFYNQDPNQCMSNTSCVFRATDDKPKCACDTDHFFTGQYCIARAKVNEPCPVGNETAGIPEVEKQCVDSAHCNVTSGHCECQPGHYYRSGRCPLLPTSGR